MQKIPGGTIMKTLTFFLIGSALILASCSSSRYVASREYDDVYYNPDVAERQASAVVQEPVLRPEEAMSAQPVPREQTYAEPEGYAEEDLSDYEKYWMQKEAEMLGETYEPQGSEAAYASQYEQYDSIDQASRYGEESAPVIVNNYNYYYDPNDYYYSSNLRRFSDRYYGWDYYDPFYTSLYWYTLSLIHI